MKSHFHITGFTASLALKQKFGATRKFSEMVYFSKLFWGSNRPEPPKPRPPPPPGKEGDSCRNTKDSYAVEKPHPLPANHLESYEIMIRGCKHL